MSASQSRATDEINLDEFERRLRAAGAQQARAEDPLAELSRLVEFSHMGISNGETRAARAPPSLRSRAREALCASIETAPLRPSLDDEVEELAPGASEADRAARRDYEFDAHRSDGASAADADEERRPMRWKLAVSALALAGVAMIGAVFVAQGRRARPEEGRPVHRRGSGTDQGRAAERPDGHDVQRRRRHSASRQRQAGLGQSRQFRGAAGRLERAGVGQQSVSASAPANPLGERERTRRRSPRPSIRRLSPPPAAAPPKGMTSEFPDPKPVRTISLQAGRNADRLRQRSRSAGKPTRTPRRRRRSSRASQPASAERACAEDDKRRDGRRAAVDAQDRIADQAFTAKSSARVAVGKTDTTRLPASEATAQTPAEPAQNGAPAKPEKAAKKPKAGQVADATETTGSIAAAGRRDGRDHFGRLVRSARRAQIGSGSKSALHEAQQQVQRRAQRLAHRRA